MTPTDWSKPQPVTQAEIVFGGDMGKLLPPQSALPDEFSKELDAWCDLADRWFARGIDPTTIRAKEGIDKHQALLHLKAIMSSFGPKREHKIAGVGWLMSQWFEELT